MRQRLADSFPGGRCCVVALWGAGRCVGFSESRRRLGLTVDRLVPGFVLGCPLQTGGSIASTGTSAPSHGFNRAALGGRECQSIMNPTSAPPPRRDGAF